MPSNTVTVDFAPEQVAAMLTAGEWILRLVGDDRCDTAVFLREWLPPLLADIESASEVAGLLDSLDEPI